MNKVALVTRIILGLIFLIFGLNGFLHFIPMPAPSGLAGQFMGSLALSHFLLVVMALQVLGGLLLLSGRFTALALLLLAPVIVNILLFHAFMQPSGLPLAVVVVLLWIGSAWSVRNAFVPVLRSKYQREVSA